MEFIDLKSRLAKMRGSIDDRIATVLDHGRFILGPEVAELEETLAEYVGVKHCVGVASGTDSLLIALMALKVGPGDEVITVPYTWISSAVVISLAGATPVFVDIEKTTWNMDPTLLEAAITDWAPTLVGENRPLTIYLMDHGRPGKLYLDKARREWVTPEQLDGWLDEVQAASPGLKINVIIEACYAGSFLAREDSIAGTDRVIVTSTADNSLAWAAGRGARAPAEWTPLRGRDTPRRRPVGHSSRPPIRRPIGSARRRRSLSV